MHIFDILGPVMVGPSSSHTAGAVRIGLTARAVLGDTPVRADIGLHGSFAATGSGHGTDRALVAGLMGMQPHDTCIPNSFDLAREQGLHFAFSPTRLKEAHPNTAVLTLTGSRGGRTVVRAASLGGGRIRVEQVDGLDAAFTGEMPTLLVFHLDKPGQVTDVTRVLSQGDVNIATMQLYRSAKGGQALMVIQLDQAIDRAMDRDLRALPAVTKLISLGGEVDEYAL